MSDLAPPSSLNIRTGLEFLKKKINWINTDFYFLSLCVSESLVIPYFLRDIRVTQQYLPCKRVHWYSSSTHMCARARTHTHTVYNVLHCASVVPASCSLQTSTTSSSGSLGCHTEVSSWFRNTHTPEERYVRVCVAQLFLSLVRRNFYV